MDEYTAKTKDWLDNRFRQTDEQGIYRAHQPLYGFRTEPCEPNNMLRYLITFNIMKTLAALNFGSLLDVGGAEGYKAFLAQKLFGATVATSDLSPEACKRAREIFGIPAIAADIHALPFADNEYDVVMCSESLEHVADYRQAMQELLRVAKHAVIITVPHEPDEVTAHNLSTSDPHGHIHSFNLSSFDYLKGSGCDVIVKRMVSSLSVIPASLIDASPRVHNREWKHPESLTRIYNSLVPVARILLGRSAAASLTNMDRIFCALLPFYKSHLFLIMKGTGNQQNVPPRPLTPKEIIDFAVPHHYLK